MHRLIAVSVFAGAVGLVSALAGAGEFNQTLNVGDEAPAWEKLPGTDGREHALADLKDKDVVVVVFTCNSCPVAVGYEDRILALAKQHAEKVAFVAINVNRIPEDSLEQMKLRAEEKGFPFAYLFDESQQIAREYGAQSTPEFFVLNKERKIVYMGALDDSTDAAAVKTQYLAAAIAAALEGKAPATQETYPHGCRIRFERSRSRRAESP